MNPIISRNCVIALMSCLTIGTKLGINRAHAQATDFLGGGFTHPIHVTASSRNGESSPEKTLNGSGLSNRQHSTNDRDAWHSPSTSPHPVRPSQSNHWIQYDLGKAYALGKTRIWNLNGANQTQNGFRWITVDYSTDGTTWNRLSTFELPQAPGHSNYLGSEGPDFNRLSARYVLFTALSNWGGSGDWGLAEVQIENADAPSPAPQFPVNGPTPLLATPSLSGLDLDGDGMSDAWEAYYQADTLKPFADDDGDRHTNLEEARAGSDPFDPNQFFEIESIRYSPAQSEIEITWSGVAGKRYQIATSKDLNTWVPQKTIVQNSTEITSITIRSTPGEGHSFCRLLVEDLDQDKDGLTAYEEALFQTSDKAQHSEARHSGNDYIQALTRLTSPGVQTLNGRKITGRPPSLADAYRFLSQSTLGADYELITQVASTGFTDWIEREFAKPPTSHVAINNEIRTRTPDEDEEIAESPYIWAWWEAALKGNDLLRQRVAFALSEIFVIGQTTDTLEDITWGVATYYDLLVDGAFGNYRDLLYNIATNPAMGHYLSHVKNRPTNPAENLFPDENFAREIMQLFSIGLFELNQDGSRKLDSKGQPIPTYTNRDITEFARVFTGLTFDPSRPTNGTPWEHDEPNPRIENEDDYLGVEDFYLGKPMFLYEPMHERGIKHLLRGETTNGSLQQDLNAAIDNLFHHPNVGPFIGQRLIQRLVKSNPSPNYIYRVAAAFNDNGAGVRGDMKAVLRTILLDPEARSRTFLSDPNHGKLREPLLRHTQLAKAFNLSTRSGRFWNSQERAMNAYQQQPMLAPSVFNFYLPNHQPIGPIADAGLVAPEFQITTATTTIKTLNYWAETIPYDDLLDNEELTDRNPRERESMDYADEIALVNDIPRLVDRLDLLLTRGQLNAEARTIITDSIQRAKRRLSPSDLIRFSVYLFVCSPDYAILR